MATSSINGWRSNIANWNRHVHNIQLYFYKNFFGPKHESAILNHENLHKKLVQALSNEFFTLDNGNNEEIIQQYIVKVSNLIKANKINLFW